MKRFTALIGVCLLAACYGWEYPSYEDIQRVEREAPIRRFLIHELEGQSRYVGSVIEVEGRIGSIINKGGQPSVGLTDGRLGVAAYFGPKEREPIKQLSVGDTVTLKGILTTVPEYQKSRGTLIPAIAPRTE